MAVALIATSITREHNSPTDKSVGSAGYLFTYFTKNGEDGLHLAASINTYRWQSVVRAPDHWQAKTNARPRRSIRARRNLPPGTDTGLK